jgi:hypothetical protein
MPAATRKTPVTARVSDHARSTSAGSHINGQTIPSSRFILAIGSPQHLPGIPAVFQQLRHLYWVAM